MRVLIMTLSKAVDYNFNAKHNQLFLICFKICLFHVIAPVDWFKQNIPRFDMDPNKNSLGHNHPMAGHPVGLFQSSTKML
jgi:hypothetical protein